MPTTEERLAALETKLAALTATTPTEYYTHQYSGEEIDAAVGRAATGGALDTSVTNVSNQLGTFVRPNLLDNWYFGRPVNQRGKTEYTGPGYGIDRWKIEHGTVISLSGGALVITSTPENGIVQNSEALAELLDKRGTFSVLTPSGDLYSTGLVIGNASGGNDAGDFIIYSTSDTLLYIRPKGLSPKSILAVKLELGSTQTLAHREGDKWILNEIPDYGEQLARCQRYCRVYKAGESLPYLAYAESNGWYLSASMYIGNMRTTPINNLGSGLSCSVRNIDSDKLFDKTILNWGIVGSTIQRIRISRGDATPGPFPYNVMPKQDLIFSADL